MIVLSIERKILATAIKFNLRKFRNQVIGFSTRSQFLAECQILNNPKRLYFVIKCQNVLNDINLTLKP